MYYPDLTLPEEEPHYGKYGRMRLRHLKEHRKVLDNTLLLDGELDKHLNEALKARDQMAWGGTMNNIHNAAEEIVLSELIYN